MTAADRRRSAPRVQVANRRSDGGVSPPTRIQPQEGEVMINSRKLAGTSAALGLAWALAGGALLAPSTASAAECERKTWDEQPKVVIHTSEFEGTETAQANMIDAITDVNEQLNGVGATAAAVTATQVSTDPFT
jgi:hypothetical protein